MVLSWRARARISRSKSARLVILRAAHFETFREGEPSSDAGSNGASPSPGRRRVSRRSKYNGARPGLEALELRALLSGQPTTLSAVTGSGTHTETATLSADLTSGGSPVPGEPVEFTLNDDGTVTSVGAAMTDSNGIATLVDVSLADFNVGIFAGLVGASFAGDASYDRQQRSAAR